MKEIIMKRMMTLLLVMVLSVSLFAGCGKTDTKDEGSKSSATTDTKDGDTGNASVDTDKNESDDQVVFTVNDEDILLSSVNVLVYQVKKYYEAAYGPTVWDMDASEGVTAEEFVKKDIKEISTRTEVLYQIAQKEGYELDEDKKTELLDQASKLYESYPQDVLDRYGFTLEAIQDMLLKQGISELVFKEMTKDTAIDQDALQEQLDADQTYQNIMKYGVDNYSDQLRVRHILIKTVDDNYQPLSDEEIAAAKAQIEDLLEQAKNGEDFAALATQYSEDPGSKDVGGEYTFGRGRMVPEFEEAAYALEVGEISDIVETAYGYHIIKLEEKIPSTEEDIAKVQEQLDSIKTNAEDIQKTAEFNKKYEELVADYTITTNDDVWSSITLKDPVEESTDTPADDSTTDTTDKSSSDDTTTGDNAASDESTGE